MYVSLGVFDRSIQTNWKSPKAIKILYANRDFELSGKIVHFIKNVSESHIWRSISSGLRTHTKSDNPNGKAYPREKFNTLFRDPISSRKIRTHYPPLPTRIGKIKPNGCVYVWWITWCFLFWSFISMLIFNCELGPVFFFSTRNRFYFYYFWPSFICARFRRLLYIRSLVHISRSEETWSRFYMLYFILFHCVCFA